MGFCIDHLSVIDQLAIVELFWQSGCIYVPVERWLLQRLRFKLIRVNVWTVCWDQKHGRHREIVISGGSTIYCMYMYYTRAYLGA